MKLKKKIQPIGLDIEENQEKDKNILENNLEENILDSKSKLDEIADNVEQQKQEKTEKPKSKYKLKKELAQKEQQEIKENISKTISGVGSILMNLVVDRLPNPKPLQEKEAEQINLAFDKLADKYAPKLLGEYQEEFAFLVAVVVCVLPRIEKPEEKKPE